MAEQLPIASDAVRFAVAVRMIEFEARTRTIRLATRLSEDQIRRLYRQAGLATTSPRHRGRSPTSATQYTRSFAAQLESSIFSGVLVKHGLLKGRRPKPWLHDGLHYAQRFCDAYAEYQHIAHQAILSFEQAWFLARSLAAHGELYLQRCAKCVSHFVRDTSTVLKHHCPLCQLREQPTQETPAKPAKRRRSRVKPANSTSS
jgi:Flagellar transcriptional activator (FlhC)